MTKKDLKKIRKKSKDGVMSLVSEFRSLLICDLLNSVQALSDYKSCGDIDAIDIENEIVFERSGGEIVGYHVDDLPSDHFAHAVLAVAGPFTEFYDTIATGYINLKFGQDYNVAIYEELSDGKLRKVKY